MKVHLNTSKKDRIMRIVLALIFIALNLAGIIEFPENILLWIVAGILISTAVAGICPLYTLFGINTLTKKKAVMKR